MPATPRFSHVRMKTFSIIFERFGHVNQVFFSPAILLQLVRFRPEVVLTEGASNILNNLITCSYCLLTKTPYIWWDLGKIRGQASENRFRRLLNPVIKFYFRRAEIILGYSNFAKDFFHQQGVPPQKIVVAGNTVRLKKHLDFQQKHANAAGALKKKLGLENKFVFLAVGGLEKAKRFDLLIKVFQQLQKKEPQIALVFVGAGPEQQRLQKLAGDNPNCHFAGAHFEDVGLYFMLANMFVLPGLGGLAINEAMAYGLPVIAAPADGTELDTITEGKTGFLINRNDPAGLFEKMNWCVKHPDKVREMGVQAKSLILSEYSLERMIENIKIAIVQAVQNQ